MLSIDTLAQSDKQQVKTERFGMALEYGFYSLIGDSVRPVNLSFRYKMRDKHTFQLYVPLSFKRSHIRKTSNVRKETVYGIGIGYDYTFVSYSLFDFFAGIKADYRWYQSRYDRYSVYPVYKEDKIAYEQKEEFYYRDKVNGISLTPNAGIRVSAGRVATELLMDISINRLERDAYSFTEINYPAAKSTWEELYPDKDITELKVCPGISINLSYYF